MKKRIYTMVFTAMLLPLLVACGKDSSEVPESVEKDMQADVSVTEEPEVSSGVAIESPELIVALQHALDKSDSVFTEQELGELTEITIECTENTSLSELELLDNLMYVNLTGGSKTVLEDLKSVASLEYLYLQEMELRSLSELPVLDELRVLSLDNTSTTSLEGIEAFASLEELYVTGSVITDDAAVQDTVNKLKSYELEFAEEEYVSEIVFIDAGVEEEVRNAILNYTMPITKAEMDLIDTIVLTNPEICALDDLEQCENLKSLILMDTQVTNILPLLNMEALESLMIYTDKELDYSVLLEKESIKNICINNEWVKGSHL